MSRLIISNKQRKLIIESESAKGDFQELYDYLIKHKELRKSDLQKYKQFENIDSYYDQLLLECQSEWEIPKINAVIDLGENYLNLKRECELCNQKNIRYEHRITNKINKKTLVIGSECSKEFGSDVQGALRDELRKVKRASRMRLLEEKIPGIRDFKDNSHNYINELEIIIPISLDEQWYELSKSLVREYNEFVNNDRENFKIIESLWEEKNHLEQKINNFIKENKNKKFVANKKIFTWLKRNNELITIKMIKENNGFIEWKTAHRIYEIEFMREILNDLAQTFKDMGIKPLTVNGVSTKVSIEFMKDRKSIIGVIDFKTLILNYAGVLFGEQIDFTFEDLYEECRIEDWNSKIKIVDLTKISNFRLNKQYIEDDELIYFRNEKFFLCKLDEVVDRFKMFYFNNTLDEQMTSEIIESITNKIMDKREVELHVEAKEIAKELHKR